ncbi:MAG: rhomboid family intramembrane serine protease [Gammaproteobacteria bacterium]|nr:rhomboid family intramembrane serine protease [Gammaproteobacteria bacterium]MCW8909630.1 rhomboid family intramembrane serine protease [Gammaproteobacteria bacterium]
MFPLHDDNPTKIIPYITYILIGSCLLTFFWQLSLGPYAQNAVLSLGMIPAVVFNTQQLHPDLVTVPALATFFTSMFLHGGWMHLIGNMLYLWIFGNNVEDAMGHKRFITFYLICGVAAALAQALPDPGSTTPMIGASGAISGVLGAYLLLYPHARVLVAIPFGFYIHTTRIKAGWVLGFWFALQIFNSIMSGDQQGGVAWGAHIGGFVAGLALIPFFKYKHVALFAPARNNY